MAGREDVDRAVDAAQARIAGVEPDGGGRPRRASC